jgi:hypothetical protein
MSKKVLTHTFSEPLCGAASMTVNIDPGDGNLVIDSLPGGEPVLASGTLQYLENKGLPTRSVETNKGPAAFSLKASGGQPWLRLPWSGCNGATEWHVHLNPAVAYDLKAHSDGGNIRLDLAEMTLARVSADTGGGNIDVALPGTAHHLDVTAKSGAGNVSLRLPAGVAARIRATTGLGKVIVDPRYPQVSKDLYQSPDYDRAVVKAEITLSSGAGNVSVTAR